MLWPGRAGGGAGLGGGGGGTERWSRSAPCRRCRPHPVPGAGGGGAGVRVGVRLREQRPAPGNRGTAPAGGSPAGSRQRPGGDPSAPEDLITGCRLLIPRPLGARWQRGAREGLTERKLRGSSVPSGSGTELRYFSPAPRASQRSVFAAGLAERGAAKGLAETAGLRGAGGGAGDTTPRAPGACVRAGVTDRKGGREKRCAAARPGRELRSAPLRAGRAARPADPGRRRRAPAPGAAGCSSAGLSRQLEPSRGLQNLQLPFLGKLARSGSGPMKTIPR